MTHDELDPHKTDQRDRRALEDEHCGTATSNTVLPRCGLDVI